MTTFSVILIILKILGITLLCILGIVLLIITAILFAPLRYRLTAKKITADEYLYVGISASWLLGALKAGGEYKDKAFSASARALFFRLFSYPEDENAVKKKAEKKKKKEEKRRTKEDKRKAGEEKAKNRREDQIEEKIEYKLENFDDDSSSQKESEASKEQDMDEKDSSFFDRIREFVNLMADLIVKMKNKAFSIKDKITDIGSNLSYYIEFVNNRKVRAQLSYIWTQLAPLIKHISPGKTKIYVRFGMEDPASTGQILAFLAPLYPFMHKSVKIEPVFDAVLVDADVYIRGRIRVFNVLKALFKIYFHKGFKRMFKSLKNKEAF